MAKPYTVESFDHLRRFITDMETGSSQDEAIWYGRTFLRDFAPGPIVYGDYKTPNAWSYRLNIRTSGEMKATFTERFPDNAGGFWRKPIVTQFYGRYLPVSDGLAVRHTDLMEDTDESAYNNLLENIRGNLDISVDLAQASKTMKLGSDVLKLAKQVTQMKKMVLSGRLINSAKLAGELRLFWTYGVKPTMQTVFDGLTEIRNHHENVGTWYFGKSQFVETYEYDGPINWPDAGWPNSSHAVVSDQGGVVYAALMKIPNTPAGQIARWASLNPASIAWELLPFSFVIDWFFNVGDFLRNFETSMIYNRYFQTGYKSVRYFVRCEQYAERSGAPPWAAFNSWSGFYKAGSYDKGMFRQKLDILPLPQLPRWNPNLGTGRLINAASLLSLALKRRT